jgi:uncharacterized protein (TIGR02300 family)
MAKKEARGTKRSCQNDRCDNKFYDLNRDPIVCPACDSVYKLAVMEEEEIVPPVAAAVAAAPAPVPAASADGEEVSDEDDALVSLEDADAELGADDDDAGIGDIIGGVEKEDEES